MRIAQRVLLFALIIGMIIPPINHKAEEGTYMDVPQQPTIWSKDTIESVRNLGLITGDASQNKTRERFAVGGTDLGIPIFHEDTLYLFLGDTFLGDDEGRPMQGGAWRSNVAAKVTDFNFEDGMVIDDIITTSNGRYAVELIPSLKIPDTETTVIPTGGVSVDNALYVYFMSVRTWGTPGGWDINYGGLAKSTDGQTFEKLDFELDGENFGQVAALLEDDTVYGIGIGGGRFGGAKLFRVPAEAIEDPEAYEYYTGEGYEKNLTQAIEIVEDPVGEPSVFYNEYLESYVFTYLNEYKRAIVMRTAETLEGPWSDESILVHADDYPAPYGGFTHEVMTADNGKIFYFTLSMWDPIYNVLLIEVNLH